MEDFEIAYKINQIQYQFQCHIYLVAPNWLHAENIHCQDDVI
jgi:hypothetical protein